MILYLLPILLCLVVCNIFIRYSRLGRLFSKIPGPPALPLIGNYMQFFGDAEHLWHTLHENADKYYPIYKFWITNFMVLIRHPDDLEILLTSKVHVDKASIYSILDCCFQDGVIMSKGDKWHKRRKLITPAFHIDNLKKQIEVTNKSTNEMIANVKLCGNESDQDISNIIYETLLKSFCEASLEVDLRELDGSLIDNYKKAMGDLFKIAIYRVVRPYVTNWIMPFTSLGKKQKTALQHVFKLRDELIRIRREFHKKTNYKFLKESIDTDEKVLGDRQKKLPLIDHLLLAEKNGLIDVPGINEEIDTMIATGHETSSAQMIYVIMLLAENKEAQELARKEVTEILDKSSGEVTMVEIQKFEYLDRCIKEALRLYPAAPLFIRHTKEDLQLKNYTIPAGVDIMCMAYDVHRDPNFWPNPDKYDPDRFLPDCVKERHPYSYIPFSAGPRNCIGQKLAMIQMKILTAKILYNFYLEPVDFTADMRFNASITLHPKNHVFTKFIKIR